MELIPVLAEHAAETDSARRVHPASLAAVRAEGFFASMLPRDQQPSFAQVLVPTDELTIDRT
jgi:hypothetical protein